MNSRDKGRGGPAPRRLTGHYARHAIAGVILAGLAAWSLAPAGIIELGKKGKNSNTSEFLVIANDDTFGDPNHVSGDSAEVLLDHICAEINTNSGGKYVALKCNGLAAANCPVHGLAYCGLPPDANLNALEVLRKVGSTQVELRRLEAIAEDNLAAGDGIGTAGVSFRPGMGSPSFTLTALDIDENKTGQLTLRITLVNGSSDTISFATTGDGDLDDDMAKLVGDLEAAGYNVTPKGAKARGQIKVHTTSGENIARVSYTHEDTGVSRTTVSASLPGKIPTLSTAGIVVLVILLAATAMVILRRKREAGAPGT